jgi:hypothetical protein
LWAFDYACFPHLVGKSFKNDKIPAAVLDLFLAHPEGVFSLCESCRCPIPKFDAFPGQTYKPVGEADQRCFADRCPACGDDPNRQCDGMGRSFKYDAFGKPQVREKEAVA